MTNGSFRSPFWPLSSIVLAAVGLTLVAMGVFFIALRPPLLPEDVRFMGLTATEFDTFGPRLGPWLTHLFRVLGGYVMATGALAISLAMTSYREHRWGAAVGVLLGGAASVGWMAVVNFMIVSDFRWVLLAVAFAWACSLGLFLFEKKSDSLRSSFRGDGHETMRIGG